MRIPKRELSASLMCVDFSRLEEQLEGLRKAKVTRLHLDFADGHFVPNFILGTNVFQLLMNYKDFKIESHLMIENPTTFLNIFSKESDFIIVHIEVLQDPLTCIKTIKQTGVGIGIALKPATPVNAVLPYLEYIDIVLIMTVEPGFAGNPFISSTVVKIDEISQFVKSKGYSVDIEVDGAINHLTIPKLLCAGANIFVGGSSGLFVGENIELQAKRMMNLLDITN